MFALVLLRLVIGWHFFGEGTKKVEYDRHDEASSAWRFRPTVFWTRRRGRWRRLYQAHALDDHDWRMSWPRREKMCRPQPSKWPNKRSGQTEYAQRRADAQKKGQAVPVEFPPNTASHDWADEDRRRLADGREPVQDDCRPHRRAKAAGREGTRCSGSTSWPTTWRRRASHRRISARAVAAGELAAVRRRPATCRFYKQRIAAKAGETTASRGRWVSEVQRFEDGLRDDLEAILTAEQRESAGDDGGALTTRSPIRNQHKLDFVNIVVTVVTIGVGVCLLLGFFTRLASIVGALFLLGVIVSQPFWMADAAPTMQSMRRIRGFLVLAGTGAGRWAGLDCCLAHCSPHRGER